MACHNRKSPSPFGTRLPAPILTKIYHLAIVSSTPITLDSPTDQAQLPALLQTSSAIRSRFLQVYFEQNTFTVRRASLCVSIEIHAKAKDPHSRSLPIRHRLSHVRHLHLATFNGNAICLGLEPGNPFRNDDKKQKKKKHNAIATRLKLLRQSPSQHFQRQKLDCCRFCNESTFPPLLELFPRLCSVTIDVAANHDSGVSWRTFCRSVVQGREPFWVEWTGVGVGVLRCEQDEGVLFLGVVEIRIVDEKSRKVWEGARRLGSVEVRGAVSGRGLSVGVKEVLRVSARIAWMVLKLLERYDRERTLETEGGENGTFLTRAGVRSDVSVPSGLRVVDGFWDKEFTTALNWAVREWLQRGVGEMDLSYLRAMEGGGVRDVVAASRLETALLDEFASLSTQ